MTDIERELLEGLTEFRDDLKSGDSIFEKYKWSVVLKGRLTTAQDEVLGLGFHNDW